VTGDEIQSKKKGATPRGVREGGCLKSLYHAGRRMEGETNSEIMVVSVPIARIGGPRKDHQRLCERTERGIFE